MGVVHDNENVTKIELGKFIDGEPVSLKFTTKKHKEVRLIRHNG